MSRRSAEKAHLQVRDRHPISYFYRKLGGTWTLCILAQLAERPHHFQELRAALPWIPARSLSRVLAHLESNGLIHRQVLPTRPPGVVYSLGQEDSLLRQIIELLTRWGKEAERRDKAR